MTPIGPRRVLLERRGVTTSGLRILWRHYARHGDEGECYEFTITCGAWEIDNEPDYDRRWTYERAAGLAVGLEYVAGLGPEGAAILAATLRRNAPYEEETNVVPLFRVSK